VIFFFKLRNTFLKKSRIIVSGLVKETKNKGNHLKEMLFIAFVAGEKSTYSKGISFGISFFLILNLGETYKM